jgi:hypothetical protein
MVPVFSYSIPMLGAALSALLFMNVIRAMRFVEAAGVGAVAGGMAEANLPVLVALYLAIFMGMIGILIMIIRCFVSTTTASPSAWFFAIGGVLASMPLMFLWEAQSLMVAGMKGGNVSLVASSIQLCLTLTIVTSALFVLILLVASVTPLPSLLRAKRNWAPLLLLATTGFALIGAAVAFQIQTSWLYGVSAAEQF